MSRPTDVLKCSHWEDEDLVLMARILGADAANITQATITSVSVNVFDLTTETQVLTTLEPSVADVVFDTLQTDDRWSEDATGYNFRYTVPGTHFPDGGRHYRVEVIFEPVSGSDFAAVFVPAVKDLMSS